MNDKSCMLYSIAASIWKFFSVMMDRPIVCSKNVYYLAKVVCKRTVPTPRNMLNPDGHGPFKGLITVLKGQLTDDQNQGQRY